MPALGDRHTLPAMDETNIEQQFLECLAARDFDRLTALFAAGAQGRLLLPRGLVEVSGRDEIGDRFRGWFGAASSFEIRMSSEQRIGRRRRLSWLIRAVREGDSVELVEQNALLDLGPDGIERLDLICSGFHPERTEPVTSEPIVFDAGSLGCADGLAQEFRRRIEAVPVGASLAVIIADPAGKEDLPPLARMLGHNVQSAQALQDGRLTITVERCK
jgi:TusA-related sulfurtransferase